MRARMLELAGPLAADRRRARPRLDARDRARRHARRARSGRSRPRVIDEALARGLLLLRPASTATASASSCRSSSGTRARRGARRLGRRARRRALSPLREGVPSEARWSGSVLADRYELEELVGTGGMSSVYRAHDRLLDRKVALKILHQHYAADDDYVERFRREARAVATLSHPNIVTVIDRGEHDGPAVHRLRVRRRREPEAADRAARAAAGRARRSSWRSRSRAGSSFAHRRASSTAT